MPNTPDVIIPVEPIEGPTVQLCYAQDLDTMSAHCDRAKGHHGPHTWQLMKVAAASPRAELLDALGALPEPMYQAMVLSLLGTNRAFGEMLADDPAPNQRLEQAILKATGLDERLKPI